MLQVSGRSLFISGVVGVFYLFINAPVKLSCQSNTLASRQEEEEEEEKKKKRKKRKNLHNKGAGSD
ncbi:hypothetical protein EYF80_059257 [Liparis tanakae]|uniref:Uncharacterized protein n=1 Tax=Liparis tanakae TaxID=230148 RepID=A0A4Z2EQN9_9TELE|nr:hypothetical protein EYF80_059257 [Liparis tanakae]